MNFPQRVTLLLITIGLCLAAPARGEVRPLAKSRVVPRVLKLIRLNYVAPDLIEPRKMLIAALDEIQRTIPEILAIDHGGAVSLTIGQATRRFHIGALPDASATWKQLSEIFSFIDLHYHGETKTEDIEYLAVEGVLKTLDPHSNLLRPKEYDEFRVGTKGNFGGVGIVIGNRDGHLAVIAPLDGTPAGHAGLRPKDRIVQIDEHSTINMSLTEAVELIRGPVGSVVVLSIERPKRPQFTVALKRAIIQIDSVQSKLLSIDNTRVGYVKIKTFQENTTDELRTQVRALREQVAARPTGRKAIAIPATDTPPPEFSGLIIDLRNNPGGLLQQAVDMTDLFLAEGIIVSTVGARGRFLDEHHRAQLAGTEPPYPIVVLLNEGSASASEIVAGSLQDAGRALVVGARSFGKGSVQTIYDLRDGSALKMTIAEYLTGGQHAIQWVGVTPDVELLPLTVDKDEMNLVEDELYSEKKLEKSLDRHVGKITVAPYRLAFLQPKVDPEDEDKRSYATTLDLDDDFAVQFAQQLLTKHTPAMGASWGPLQGAIATAEQDQEVKLSAALKALGIDWSTSPSVNTPQLRITYAIQQQGKPVTSVMAGEKADIVLTATNVGKGSYSRLVGQTKSDLGLLANKEFVFGTLAPGTSRTWSIPIEVGKHMLSEQIPVTVEFHEGNKQQPKSFVAMLPVRELARPQFAYSYRLGKPIRSKVKTHKPLPLGKSLPLTVTIKNVGKGPSLDALVSIRNVDGNGPFIEVGRVKLGTLAPEASATATLSFHVDPSFQGSSFTMELAILDTEILESISDKLEFTIGSGRIDPPAGPWYRGPTILLANGLRPQNTRHAEQQLQGSIRDDQRVKDYFIFVGDKKIHYQSNPEQSGLVNLAIDLPLEKGSNIVTIAARDNDNLMSRKTITIYRSPGNTTALKSALNVE